MNIKEILNVKTVNLESKALSKKELLLEAGNMLLKEERINDLDKYIEDIFERESLESTNLDMGIAIPHLQSLSVNQTSIVIIRVLDEIDWLDDGEIVKIIFLFAVSKNDPNNTHLQLLSQVAVLLMDDDFKEFLFNTEDKEELLNIIYQKVEV